MDDVKSEEAKLGSGAVSHSAEERRMELLTFMLEDEEYGVDIMSIREIIRPVPITLVPRVPGYILGIVSLRGRILPVFDLRSRLKLRVVDRPKKPRYIIVTTKQGLVGMIGDTVTGVLRLSESDVDPPPNVIGGEEGDFIRGVAKDGDRLIILLDVDRVCGIGNHGKNGINEKVLHQ